MTKELACTDINTTYSDLQKAAFFVADKKFNIISVPLSFINYVKTYIESTPEVKIAVNVDFPYGLEITEVRQINILHAVRKGADIIDIPLNSNLVVNDNWKALRADSESCFNICKEKNVQIRFVLDYRLFDDEITVHICKTLSAIGVDTVITTNGIGPDDAANNLIIAQQIKAKTGLSAIICSSMLQKPQLKLVSGVSTHFAGFRLTSLGMAENLFGKIGV
jgi:deoxyribose-phosphate aldolase